MPEIVEAIHDAEALPADPILIAAAVERHLARHLERPLTITDDNRDAVYAASAQLARAFAGQPAAVPMRHPGPVVDGGEADGLDERPAVAAAIAAIYGFGGPRVDRTRARRLLSSWTHYGSMSSQERVGTLRRFPTQGQLMADPYAPREQQA